MKTPKIVANFSSSTVIDAASAGVNFCKNQPELCESALKTGAASRDILAIAANTLSLQMADKKENTPSSR